MKPRPIPRWQRRKEARVPEIVAAALEIFAERGFAATRLDDVAARAGVTKGTLYLYFPSKEELFKEMVRQSILPMIAAREEMIQQSTAPSAELLSRFLLSLPEVMLDSPVSAIPKLMIAEARNFPDLARFYLDEVISRSKRMIVALIERGIARGEFRRPVDIDQSFFCVMAPVLVAALWKHSFGAHEPGMLDPRALVRTHVDLLLHGLLTAGEAS
jgi:AcrR family transcriptional regulator